MSDIVLSLLAEEWSDMSNKALSVEKIPIVKMQRLLKETYEALFFYHKFGLAPKEVITLLFEMDHYIYFSTLMKDEYEPEKFPYYQAVSCVVKAMEEGFLKGMYEHAFPLLKVYDILSDKTYVIDLKNGNLTDIM